MHAVMLLHADCRRHTCMCENYRRARTRECNMEDMRDARAYAPQLVLGRLRQTLTGLDRDTLCMVLHIS